MALETIRDRIIKHYNALYKYANEHFKGVFPSLEDIDPVDIVIVMTMYFVKNAESADYRSALKSCMSLNGVSMSDSEFDKHYNAIHSELHSLVLLIKNNSL